MAILNATFEPTNINTGIENKILDMILFEFEQNKIYLNSDLNILDVVQAVGSNRTYISTLINQQYNQNFCTFVNNYRLDELNRIFVENTTLSNEFLAAQSGFGSLNSMKRAMKSRSGYSISEWKNSVLSLNPNFDL